MDPFNLSLNVSSAFSQEIFSNSPCSFFSNGSVSLSFELTKSQDANCPLTHKEPLLGAEKSGVAPSTFFPSLINSIPHPTPQ